MKTDAVHAGPNIVTLSVDPIYQMSGISPLSGLREWFGSSYSTIGSVSGGCFKRT